MAAVLLFSGCTESPIYRGGERSRVRTVTPQPAPHPEKGFFSPPVYNLRRSRISSWFGVRKNPRHNIREFHKGIDIRARAGEPVLSSAPGVIEFAGRKSGFGKVVIISHSRGYHTVYAHLSTILCKEGTQVERGEKIGRAGSSGNATGIHLHFEIRKYSKALDPSLFLDL
ncbi:MAG: M23 family metallopeptidase [Candidatus Krumholzibacteriales bacterium]